MPSFSTVLVAAVVAGGLSLPALAQPKADAGSGPTSGATSTNDAGSGPTKGMKANTGSTGNGSDANGATTPGGNASDANAATAPSSKQ
jgi:hypothetical protein